jgi:hypothetical protein
MKEPFSRTGYRGTVTDWVMNPNHQSSPTAASIARLSDTTSTTKELRDRSRFFGWSWEPVVRFFGPNIFIIASVWRSTFKRGKGSIRERSVARMPLDRCGLSACRRPGKCPQRLAGPFSRRGTTMVNPLPESREEGQKRIELWRLTASWARPTSLVLPFFSWHRSWRFWLFRRRLSLHRLRPWPFRRLRP